MDQPFVSPLPAEIDALWERRAELNPNDASARALVVAAACGVSGVRAVPPSIGPLTSGAGLFALAALLVLHVAAADASPPIAFAIAIALAPLGAALYAWRRAWEAFRDDAPSRRAVGVAIAGAGSIGLFLAVEILRAAP